MKRLVGTVFCLLIYWMSWSQDMSEGYELLESGEFKKAERYFEGVLSSFPENKTAQICYGRATGLAGYPSKALSIFSKLNEQYPNDTEVLLNRSEAFLWIKDGEKAIKSYQEIFQANPQNFAAILGLANSYSMQKEYTSAYDLILKAEQMQPDNDQVLLSKKYITLGLANQLASEKNEYQQALELINLNLQKDSSDQESLTLKATIYLIAGDYENALKIYASLQNHVEAVIGQSVSYHLIGNDTKALSIAREPLNMIEVNRQEKTKLQNNYISALLWNDQIQEAMNYSDSLLSTNPDDKELILSQAQIAVYASDYTQGVKKYEQYLHFSPGSFNANLGKADAEHALGMDNIAYDQALKASQLFPGQKDISNFTQKLNHLHSPTIQTTYLYGYSSDGSILQGYQLGSTMSLSPLVNTQINYQNKKLHSQSGTQSISETYSISGSKRFSPTLKVKASVGYVTMDYQNESENESRSDIDIQTEIRVNKNLNLTLAYLNEVQDFNEALLQQNIKIQHAVLKSAFFWKLKGLGSYTEAYRSFYSDGNTRNLLFTSFYKTFSKIKPLKVGLNYLYMGFDQNLPEAYYSPEFYHQTEVFGELTFMENQKLPIGLNWNIAGGFQMADQASQSTWRTSLSLNKQMGRVKFDLKSGYSSIVANQTNGFSHFTFQVSAKIRLMDKPVFSQKDNKKL